MLSDGRYLETVQHISAIGGRGEKAEDPVPPATRERRESVLLAAEVSRFGNPAVTKHRLRDLSPNGGRIDTAHALRRGETVLITVGSLAAIGATVVWVSEGAAGLRFFELIDPAAAWSKTIVKAGAARLNFSSNAPSPVRHAEITGWLNGLESAYG